MKRDQQQQKGQTRVRWTKERTREIKNEGTTVDGEDFVLSREEGVRLN